MGDKLNKSRCTQMINISPISTCHKLSRFLGENFAKWGCFQGGPLAPPPALLLLPSEGRRKTGAQCSVPKLLEKLAKKDKCALAN